MNVTFDGEAAEGDGMRREWFGQTTKEFSARIVVEDSDESQLVQKCMAECPEWAEGHT